MKIAYLAAGAGGMVCGSCIRDNTLARALGELGHEVAFLPLYTPLRLDEDGVEYERVFYGAVNIYLEQKLPLLRLLPGFVHRLLDHPRLLALASRLEGSTDARALGALALSMLQGEQGRQRRELEELVEWLASSFRPEVVQLTNSMLLGIARRVREELPDALLVCTLQGEDIFLDDLVEPFRSSVLAELRKRARDVDVFVATSRYCAQHMAEVLDVPPEKIRVARLGLNLEGHGGRGAEPEPDPIVVGYLARFCPEKGFHLLVDAFRLLRERLGPGRVRLRAAGYLGARDRDYFEVQRRRIDEWGLSEDVELVGEVDRRGKVDFLHGLHLFSTPTTYRETKGLPALEAMANGVPVVLPSHGAFPELVAETGGGILVEPNDAEALAEGLERLARDGERRRQLGAAGERSVHQRYDANAMARETVAAYCHTGRLTETA